MERRKAENERRPKSFKHIRKIYDVDLLGLSRAASWSSRGLFGSYEAVLEPSSGALEHSWLR
eukprot:411863-Pyramimonas_sp.AAC.1